MERLSVISPVRRHEPYLFLLSQEFLLLALIGLLACGCHLG